MRRWGELALAFVAGGAVATVGPVLIVRHDGGLLQERHRAELEKVQIDCMAHTAETVTALKRATGALELCAKSAQSNGH